MTKNNSMLEEELILMELDAKNNLDAIRIMAEEFLKNNYVKESFVDAVIEREKIFATGLPTEFMGVAIPHADPEHVKSPAMGLGILKNPVDFQVMGDHNSTVSVSLIFMIATSDSHAQLDILQKLMNIFESNDTLQLIKNSKTIQSISEIFS